MKIDINISDCTPIQAAQMFTFLAGTEGYIPPTLAEVKPAKRPRRTKVEMEAAAAAETEAAGGEAPTDEKPNRRAAAKAAKAKASPTPAPRPRRDGASTATPEPEDPTAAAPAAEVGGGTAEANTATTASPSDEEGDVNDADVAKAASIAAQTLGREVVMGVLEEFGVSIVSELDQAGRADFLSLLDQKLEDHKAGKEIPFT